MRLLQKKKMEDERENIEKFYFAGKKLENK